MTKEQPRPAGASASSPAARFAAPVIFGHFLLAAAELVVWIVYLIVGKTPLAWVAFLVFFRSPCSPPPPWRYCSPPSGRGKLAAVAREHR